MNWVIVVVSCKYVELRFPDELGESSGFGAF